MEKKELLKKYIDEIKTYRFYELIPYLMNGGTVIEKNTIDLVGKTYRSVYTTKGLPYPSESLVICEFPKIKFPVAFGWEEMISDGYIKDSDLSCAIRMSEKTYESMKKGADEDTRTDEEIDDDMKLFRKFAEMMSMDLVGVNGNKTPFSEFAKVIKDMDDIISKRENK